MRILITGDLVINQAYDSSNINQNVIDLFNQSDLNIVNLEAPVTSSNSRILKTGPHLKSENQSTLNVLEALKIDVLTLANNHVLDYDEEGVRDTLSFCSKNSIQSVGAGMNLKEASKTLFVDSPEGIIAIVNFAENEWANATANSAGANPMDIIDNSKQIKEAKKTANYVIVIVHGGHEYYNLPSPRIQKQYRFYAEQGADLIVGHHTHCISGNEIYKGVPIYYSLGNFLFTTQSAYVDWYTGLILDVEIKDKILSSKLYIVDQENKNFNLSISSNQEEILRRIERYNSIIKTPEKLHSHWMEYIKSRAKSYLKYWSPLRYISNRYIRALFNKLNITFISKSGLSLRLNLLRCEAHRDISIEVINKYLEE